MELIVKQLNDCIGQIFMPVHMLGVVLGTSFVVFGLLQYDLEPMIQLIAIGVLVMIAFYYKFLIGRGSYFCQASFDALLSMKWALTTPYLVKKHRACRILKPSVGGFFPLTQHTVATMYQSSAELTCDLLLMQT